MTDTHFEVAPKENRQAAIEGLDIGDCVSIARRIHLQFGIEKDGIQQHTDQVRGIMDQQTHRARRKTKGRKFKVEHGSFITRDGALIITAVCTRTD